MASQQKVLPTAELPDQGPVAATPVDQPNENLQAEIARLAYRLWQARGCPEGSPEQDWFDAERTLVPHEIT